MKLIFKLTVISLIYCCLSCTPKTVKNEIQTDVKEMLRKNLSEFNADSGMVLLMDKTGKLIVNINLHSENGQFVEGSNQTANLPKEIGNLFTPVSMLAVLQDNIISPTDSINGDNGIFFYQEDTITDHNAANGGYGIITAEQVIAFSSNKGIAQIILKGYEQAPDRFLKKMKQIIFDNVTVCTHRSLPRLSIGYGIKTSPISMLCFYNDIANGNKPHETAIQKMLVKSVEEGTGKPAYSEKVSIAGKTGTLSKEDNTLEVSFCGYFPTNNPQYTCLVIVSNPKNVYPLGGLIAGSIFKQVAESLQKK